MDYQYLGKNQTGCTTGDTITHTILTPSEPIIDELRVIQCKLGYHPSGYGEPMKVVTRLKQHLMCITEFTHYANCD